MILAGFYNEIKEPCRRTNLGNGKSFDCEETYDDCDDKSVKVISQEGCFNTANKSVKNDADRKQEGCRNNVHSSAKLILD